ncbi:MAG: 2-hydroxyacyl-CoA dehydratase [Opitutaceae bacterium]|jgi:predicted CoA-substrate-specific enzyme activase
MKTLLTGNKFKTADVIDPRQIGKITDDIVLGVDIGSRAAKAVLFKGDELFVAQVPTGVQMQDTADELFEELLDNANISRDEISFIVGTGYGRVAIQFLGIRSEIVTEISCHALGVHYLNSDIRTIIDIGGQDSKAIQVDPSNGKVLRFIMNDKCAAGTGRFLEKAAGLLDYTLAELGPESLKAESQPQISSQCTVFAESEIISLRARGVSRADIASGIHLATARRVRNLVSKIPLEPGLAFSGGVSNNVGMRHALEVLIGYPVQLAKLNMIYAGALGAAIYAQQFVAAKPKADFILKDGYKADLSGLINSVQKAEKSFIERKDVKKVGYLCTYTPIELLNASGAAFTRLVKCGEPDVVSQGERITKAVFCDLTKSVLGHLAVKDPLHDAVDQVVTFYTCDSMRATAQAISNFYKPCSGYIVPRVGEREGSRAFFRKEILTFRNDLEKLTGKEIGDDDIAAQIKLYNKIRRLIRDISALRKRDNPPLNGRDFLEIGTAFSILEPESLLVQLEDLHHTLSAVPDIGMPRLRLMMCGGVVADGDRRILDLVEDGIGARIVVEDHCTGLTQFYHDTDENIDPWQALANAYLDKAPCARQSPLDKKVEFSAQLAQEYNVDAVLYTYLKFCPCYGLTKNKFIKRFQSLGLPVLELATDYSVGDTGQIRTRLEAFAEVLREKSKKEAA